MTIPYFQKTWHSKVVWWCSAVKSCSISTKVVWCMWQEKNIMIYHDNNMFNFLYMSSRVELTFHLLLSKTGNKSKNATCSRGVLTCLLYYQGSLFIYGSETAIDQTAEELPLPRLCKVKVSQLVYGAITVEVWVMPTAEEANRSSLAWFWTRWWPEPLQTQNASSTRWQTFARVAYWSSRSTRVAPKG